MLHILLIENSLLENATRRFLACRHEFEKDAIQSIPPAILTAMRRQDVEPSVLDHFEVISIWLEVQVENSSSNDGIPHVLVHTDFLGASDLLSLNPIRQAVDDQSKRCALLSMLILAFPEVHWIFACQRLPYEDAQNTLFNTAHFFDPKDSKWLELSRAGFNNLFDATGLRNRMRENLRNYDAELSYLSLRERTGTAIDDEQGYAIFHSYIGYRFGFRTCAVFTARLMERLFSANGLLKPDLVLEDLYLGFADRTEADNPELFSKISNMITRDEHFPKLSDCKYRRCITSGHKQGKAPTKLEDVGKDYYFKLSSTGNNRCCHIINKPCSGVFDLWIKSSGLNDQVRKDYKWPGATQEGRPSDHSVRERLPSIVNYLVSRAEKIMRNEPSSVPVCMYGAVLASEAGEILGGRAPTTALRAIALKHEFEVVAECTFFGATYNLDVKSRLNDIQKSLDEVAVWFSPTDGPQSSRNIYAMIINRLFMRYRENNQFDEEQICLHEIRNAHWEITTADWSRFGRWTLGFLWFYALLLLSDVKLFLQVIAGWVAVLSVFFALLSWDWRWSAVPDWRKFFKAGGDGLENSFNSFLGFSVSSGWNDSVFPYLFLLVNCIAVISGIVHLGIFLGHIYSYIARK